MALFTQWDDDHYDYIWSCDCSDIHYLTMTWDDEDPDWRFLSIADAWSGKRFRHRLRGAWTLLRGHYHSGADIVLTDKTIAEVLEVLSKHSGLTKS